MFVIRHLMAALATIVGASTWSVVAGYSFWQGLGMVVLAVMFLQVLILVQVVLATLHETRTRRRVPPRDARDGREVHAQFSALPK